MSTDYPAQILNYDGTEIEVEGIVNFTDPANAPGGSLPDPITDPLNVNTGADETALAITAQDGMNANIVRIATATAGAAEIDAYVADASASVGAYGPSGGGASATVNAETTGGYVQATGATIVTLSGKTGANALKVEDNNTGDLLFRISGGGYVIIQTHAAPADAVLAAGQVALWFDQTNGAAKLKIKGKSANGTVVTGEVALA